MLPLLFVPGSTGDIFLHIPIVVLSVFFVSLIESLFILPAHLAGGEKKNSFWNILNKPQKIVNRYFLSFSQNAFRKIITRVIKNRYITFTIALSTITLVILIVRNGYLPFSFFPQIDRDSVSASAKLEENSSLKERYKAVKILSDSALKTSEEFTASQPIKGVFATVRPNGTVNIETYLAQSDLRDYTGASFSNQWQKNTPKERIEKLKSILFIGRIGFGRDTSSDIDFNISHPNPDIQTQITEEISNEMRQYKGIQEVDNSIEKGKKEFSIKLKPQAHLLNVTSNDLARQIRNYLYGSEALRFQRGEDEVILLVRLPQDERNSLKILDELVIKAPNQSLIQLKYLAEITEKVAVTEINRSKGERILSVNANVNEEETTVNKMVNQLKKNLLPKYKQRYPNFSYIFKGEEEERNKSLEYLGFATVVAIIAVYGLISIALKSYLKPLVVMISIPFGIIGAILGHLLLGYSLSVVSLIGIIGLSGIVINDALVFMTTVNRYEDQDHDNIQAAIESCIRRLRPILLTSITTFFGLLPMLFEPSVQAKFLIPMAISISFGVIFATLIILLLIPCTYVIICDLKSVINKVLKS